MGMVVCRPYVRTIQSPTPALTWYEIERYGQSCGDILATFELFIVSKIHVVIFIVLCSYYDYYYYSISWMN